MGLKDLGCYFSQLGVLPNMSIDAKCYLTKVSQRDLIAPVLDHLYCLPVCFWEQFKVLVLSIIALYGLGPAYLKYCLLIKKKTTFQSSDLILVSEESLQWNINIYLGFL